MTIWEYLDRRGERLSNDARLLANVIGLAMVGGFLGSLVTLLVHPIPKANEQIIVYMIGQLSGFAGAIVAYHYTMSAGAKALEAQRAENTGKAFSAIEAAAKAGTTGATVDLVGDAADAVADAASEKADDIRENGA